MGNSPSIKHQLRKILQYEQTFMEDLLIMHPDQEDVTLLKIRVKYIGDDEERIRHALKKHVDRYPKGTPLVYTVSHHESRCVFLDDEFMDIISEYKNDIRDQILDYTTTLKDAFKVKLKSYGFKLIGSHIMECVPRLPCIATGLYPITVSKCLRCADSALLSARETRAPSYLSLNAVELLVDALSLCPIYKVKNCSAVTSSTRRSFDIMDMDLELYKSSKEVFGEQIKIPVSYCENTSDMSRRDTIPNDIIIIQKDHCDMSDESLCLRDYVDELCEKVEKGEYKLTDRDGSQHVCTLDRLTPIMMRLQQTERSLRRRRSRAHSLTLRVKPTPHVSERRGQDI